MICDYSKRSRVIDEPNIDDNAKGKRPKAEAKGENRPLSPVVPPKSEERASKDHRNDRNYEC